MRVSHASSRLFSSYRSLHTIPPQLTTILNDTITKQSLITATFSSNQDPNISKINVRPVIVKKKLHYQISTLRNRQNFDENITPEETQEKIVSLLSQSRHASFFTKEEDIYVNENNNKVSITKKKATKVMDSALDHNRKKKYFIEEDVALPFLVHLDIMDKNGKVYTKKQDKFRQINRFLGHVNDLLPSLPSKGKLRIVDFGCGKAYLTFAVYHFLHNQLNRDVELIGVDLKKNLVDSCNDIARETGCADQVKFEVGEIDNYSQPGDVDLMISLHACNTATDKALAKAVEWDVKAILSVPCCQHELFEQIKSDALDVMLKHGILKERFAALATDALRAQLLEVKGYKTQIVEFIDMEHTSKNIMIRAVKRKEAVREVDRLKEYEAFRDSIAAEPALERMLSGLDKN
jgi:SAM-dependent methyltransferase